MMDLPKHPELQADLFIIKIIHKVLRFTPLPKCTMYDILATTKNEYLKYTHNLLLGVLVWAEEINGLHVTKVDVMAE